MGEHNCYYSIGDHHQRQEENRSWQAYKAQEAVTGWERGSHRLS